MACSTCHVVIHPDWYDATIPADGPSDSNKIGPPLEAEQDMTDLAYESQVTSRLGCTIKLTKGLDDLVVLLPRGSSNLMGFVPLSKMIRFGRLEMVPHVFGHKKIDQFDL